MVLFCTPEDGTLLYPAACALYHRRSWIRARVLHRIKSRPQATRLRCWTNCCPLVFTGPSRDFNFSREKFKPVNELTPFARPIAFHVKCYLPAELSVSCPSVERTEKCFEDDKTVWADSYSGIRSWMEVGGSRGNIE